MAELRQPHIVLTRSAEDCAAWGAELTARGAQAIEFPCISAEALDSAELGAALSDATAAADWLVFTSQRGVAAFARLVKTPLAAGVRVAVVGATTAAAARGAVGRVDMTSRGGTAAALAKELAARVEADSRVVLALAANAGTVLTDALSKSGANCTRFDVYRTVPTPAEHPKRRLSSLGADAVWFASPSAVEGFMNRLDIDARVAYFSIGPSTSAAARRAGLEVEAEARTPNLEGLLEAMQCRATRRE